MIQIDLAHPHSNDIYYFYRVFLGMFAIGDVTRTIHGKRLVTLSLRIFCVFRDSPGGTGSSRTEPFVSKHRAKPQRDAIFGLLLMFLFRKILIHKRMFIGKKRTLTLALSRIKYNLVFCSISF